MLLSEAVIHNFGGNGSNTVMAPTGRPVRMLHRKWRETKQQLSLLPDLALLGCCLHSLHFLHDILTGHPVLTVIAPEARGAYLAKQQDS